MNHSLRIRITCSSDNNYYKLLHAIDNIKLWNCYVMMYSNLALRFLCDIYVSFLEMTYVPILGLQYHSSASATVCDFSVTRRLRRWTVWRFIQK